jgi:hypothetical protein
VIGRIEIILIGNPPGEQAEVRQRYSPGSKSILQA